MTSEKDTPTPKPVAPEPLPRRKPARFDFPRGTSPEEIARAIHEMVQMQKKAKS